MYELNFRNGRYYVDKCIKLFRITIYRKSVGSFTDAEEAIKYLKSLEWKQEK
jgi:hypothetical protein